MNFVTKLKTYENAMQFKSIVEDIKLELSKDKRKNIDKILEKNPDPVSDLVGQLTKSNNIDTSSTDEVIDFLSGTLSKIENTEKIDLIVAIKPDEEIIRKIYSWVREQANKDVLLNIEVDSNMIGGIKISYRGNYMDLSLDKKLQEVFEKKELKIK